MQFEFIVFTASFNFCTILAVFYIIITFKLLKSMRKYPKELEGIMLYDGRPAYIFANMHNGRFPTKGFCCDVSRCPYCGEISSDEHCNCRSYKAVLAYNRSLDESDKPHRRDRGDSL